MSLRNQITDDMKAAMKGGDKKRVATLRLMNAAIKDKDINSRTEGHDSLLTSDSGLIELFAKMVKQRQESARAYEEGGRLELAEKELSEIKVIEEFLPAQMSEDETKAAIEAIKAELGAETVKDMGRVMATLKDRHAASLDMSKASALVKAALA